MGFQDNFEPHHITVVNRDNSIGRLVRLGTVLTRPNTNPEEFLVSKTHEQVSKCQTLLRTLTGESRTDPTRLIFIRNKNSSPFCCMISEKRYNKFFNTCTGYSKKRIPFCGIPTFHVSLIISGISFVSSIVEAISCSNCKPNHSEDPD